MRNKINQRAVVAKGAAGVFAFFAFGFFVFLERQIIFYILPEFPFVRQAVGFIFILLRQRQDFIFKYVWPRDFPPLRNDVVHLRLPFVKRLRERNGLAAVWAQVVLFLPEQVFFYIARADQHVALLQGSDSFFAFVGLQSVLAFQPLAAAQGVFDFPRKFYHDFVRLAVLVNDVIQHAVKFGQGAAHHRVIDRFLLFNSLYRTQLAP